MFALKKPVDLDRANPSLVLFGLCVLNTLRSTAIVSIESFVLLKAQHVQQNLYIKDSSPIDT